MFIDLFILGGYGQFVWSAFFFAFLSCLFLYLKTKKELIKQEKIFITRFGFLKNTRVEIAKKKGNTAEVLSGGSI